MPKTVGTEVMKCEKENSKSALGALPPLACKLQPPCDCFNHNKFTPSATTRGADPHLSPGPIFDACTRSAVAAASRTCALAAPRSSDPALSIHHRPHRHACNVPAPAAPQADPAPACVSRAGGDAARGSHLLRRTRLADQGLPTPPRHDAGLLVQA